LEAFLRASQPAAYQAVLTDKFFSFWGFLNESREIAVFTRFIGYEGANKLL